MKTTYFQLDHEFPQAGRWYLNGLTDSNGAKLDVRDFTYGVRLPLEPSLQIASPMDGKMIIAAPPLTMSIRRLGPPLDFTLGDFDVPVVTTRVAQLLSRIANSDIQRVLIHVEYCADSYEIINVTNRVSCIDLQRSDITFWTEEDGLSDMVGKPQMVGELVIDPTLVNGYHLFRPTGWEVALIVSNTLKDLLEKEQITGITFRQVSGN